MRDRINYSQFIYIISDEIYVHSIFITLLKLSAPDLSKNIYDHKPMLLHDFVQLTQKPETGWLRKPDQNRWSSKVDSDKQVEDTKFKKIIQSLKLFHAQPLMEETYDYIVVLGTSIPNLAKRFFHLAALLKTKTHFQHICLMGSDQDVTFFKPSLEKIVKLYPDKFKTNSQIPEILTEHGVMEFFVENIKEFSKEQIPEIIKLPSPVKVLDGKVVKPTTNDELIKLNSYLGMRKTHLSKIAIISHAPFHYRQNLIFLSMADKYQIETTAPDDTLYPGLNELSGSTVSQQTALDELARMFYQLHQLSLTNRDILYKNMARPKIYYNKIMYDLIIPYPNIKTFSYDEIRNQQEQCKVYNYVVTEDRDLIIADQYAVIESSLTHYAYEFTVKHPYLANDRGVLAAGDVTVIRNLTNKNYAMIKSIDNKSGHFRPGSNFLVAEFAESAFVENGFNEARGTFQFCEQAKKLCPSIPSDPLKDSFPNVASKQTADKLESFKVFSPTKADSFENSATNSATLTSSTPFGWLGSALNAAFTGAKMARLTAAHLAGNAWGIASDAVSYIRGSSSSPEVSPPEMPKASTHESKNEKSGSDKRDAGDKHPPGKTFQLSEDVLETLRVTPSHPIPPKISTVEIAQVAIPLVSALCKEYGLFGHKPLTSKLAEQNEMQHEEQLEEIEKYLDEMKVRPTIGRRSEYHAAREAFELAELRFKNYFLDPGHKVTQSENCEMIQLIERTQKALTIADYLQMEMDEKYSGLDEIILSIEKQQNGMYVNLNKLARPFDIKIKELAYQQDLISEQLNKDNLSKSIVESLNKKRDEIEVGIVKANKEKEVMQEAVDAIKYLLDRNAAILECGCLGDEIESIRKILGLIRRALKEMKWDASIDFVNKGVVAELIKMVDAQRESQEEEIRSLNFESPYAGTSSMGIFSNVTQLATSIFSRSSPLLPASGTHLLLR